MAVRGRIIGSAKQAKNTVRQVFEAPAVAGHKRGQVPTWFGVPMQPRGCTTPTRPALSS